MCACAQAKVFIEMAKVDACDFRLVCELSNNGSDEVLRVTGGNLILT